MTNKSIEWWQSSNKKLSQKNAYFTKHVPLLKTKIDLLKEQLEDKDKEILKERQKFMVEAAQHDQLRHNFEVLSALKMEELLGMVAPYEGL